MISAASKPSFFTSLLSPFTGAEQLLLEKSRLEAFLNAFPGEYCGFHKDGSIAYSDGFCAALGLTAVGRVEDIQAALEPGDSAALEGQYLKLEQTGHAFSLKVHTEKTRRIFRLRGATGAANDGGDRFNILWLEDVTDDEGFATSQKRAREAAERLAAEREKILGALPVPAWLRGAEGELVWANEAYAALLGTDRAAVIPGQMEITVPQKGEVKPPKDLARDALAEGRAQKVQTHVIVGGKRLWMEICELPLPGSHQTLGLARDISREEELNTDLTRHFTANKALLAQLRSAIAIFGANQTLEFYNHAFTTQWGLEEQWLNGRPKLGDILEKLRDNRRLPEQADFRKYKQGWLDLFTRLIEPHEDMMHLPDGSAVRLLVVPHPLGGLMMTFEDVTSRLELESSYNTLIAVQKETLDNLNEGVVVFGGDGRIKLWNPSYGRLWRLNPEDLDDGPHIGKIIERLSPFFADDEWPAMRARFLEMGLERQTRQGRLIRTDGVQLLYATMPLPDGGVVISFYDITDTARVETALRERNAALETADQLKADFLANVSYQLRTPLSAIMGFSDILDHQYFGALNPRQKEYTEGIREAGEKLIGLIDDILDLATIEAGYLELKQEPVSLPSLLETLYGLTSAWAQKQKLQITFDCAEDVTMIAADSQRLKQALLNLIRNAINFTPEGGKITLEARKTAKGTDISVRDTGIGMTEEQLRSIFQPFSRSNGRVAANSGAGLGLTLVKNIIELHGGTITVTSAEHDGTTVTLHLKD